MKIHKVRHGFATNSSSSHSMVILAPGQTASDHLVADGSFGWQYFTAASEGAKRLYLAGLLQRELRATDLDDSNRSLLIAAIAGVSPQGLGDVHVDHQSTFGIPVPWSGKGVCLDFYKALEAYVLQPNLVICGGNDNDDDAHPLAGFGKQIDIGLPVEPDARYVARQEATWWTLFSRTTGTKVRLSFSDVPEPVKASAPELVDIKITDFCPYDCPGCYQASTRNGNHAVNQTLYRLAAELGDLRVFEAAIGGGEPTLHPEFWAFVSRLHAHGVVPNFTTRNTAWMHDGEKVDAVKTKCGGFAFSTEDLHEAARAIQLARKAGLESKINIQAVVGMRRSGAASVMQRCAAEGVRCTLLGFKTTGRGADVQIHQDPWVSALVALFKAAPNIKVGIDTVLAEKHEAELSGLGVPKWCYETREGKFSAYIDAVAMKMGPSSYCDPTLMRPLRVSQYGDGSEIQKVFAKL